MSNALTKYYAARATRANAKRNARRNARIAAVIGDGMAMLSTLILIGALCALAVALAGCASLPSAAPTSAASASAGLAPCASEDSDNCYWDASTMGNGKGHSFTSVNGVVTYARGSKRM